MKNTIGLFMFACFLPFGMGPAQSQSNAFPTNMPPDHIKFRTPAIDDRYESLNSLSTGSSNEVARADGSAYASINQISKSSKGVSWLDARRMVLVSVTAHSSYFKHLSDQLNYLRSNESNVSTSSGVSVKNEEQILIKTMLSSQAQVTNLLIALVTAGVPGGV